MKKIDIFSHILPRKYYERKTNGWLGMIIEMLDHFEMNPDERRALYKGNARRILKLK